MYIILASVESVEGPKAPVGISAVREKYGPLLTVGLAAEDRGFRPTGDVFRDKWRLEHAKPVDPTGFNGWRLEHIVRDGPQDWLKDAELPGNGSPGMFCGQSLKFQCKDCGQPFWAENHCQERQCPHCAQDWAKEQGRADGERLWYGARIVAGNLNWTHYRYVHCVVSWRKRQEDHDIGVVRDRARKLAKRHGVQGGLLILHPWRQDDDKEFVPDGYIHVHIIGVADGDITGAPKGAGYIFKHIKNPKTGDFRGFRRLRDAVAAVRYLLTHAAIVKGRHSVTWFGILSYNALPNTRIVEEFPEIRPEPERTGPPCPHCGSRKTMYAVVMDGKWRQFQTPQDGPGPPGPGLPG